MRRALVGPERFERMAKFYPQRNNPSESDLLLGQAALKQLQEAVDAADYPKIAMALGRAQSNLPAEIRERMRAIHQDFLSTVRTFVAEGAPNPEVWLAKKSVTLKEAESALRALDAVTMELEKIGSHNIVPNTIMIGLRTYIEKSRQYVCLKIWQHGDSIRGEFANIISQLVEDTNDAVDMEPESRDLKLLKQLSTQIVQVYDRSCLIEDQVKGWHLTKKIRQPLRIVAKRLTSEAGVPTNLPIRPITNPEPG